MRPALRTAALALAAMLLPAATPAQRLAELPAGARLRVHRSASPTLHVTGDLVRADSGVLVVDPERGGEPVTVLLDRTVRVDVSLGAGSSRRGFWRGAKVGFAVGLAAGLVRFADNYREWRVCEDFCLPAKPMYVTAGLLTGSVGALVGGQVGRVVGGRERWDRAWPDR